MPMPSNFASVKLPSALVNQAREAAQPLRRSAAGQIEYWATLGQVLEHSGLTVQEAQAAIEGYETAARQVREKLPDSLQTLTQRVINTTTNGSLQAHIRRIVEENRHKVVQQAAA